MSNDGRDWRVGRRGLCPTAPNPATAGMVNAATGSLRLCELFGDEGCYDGRAEERNRERVAPIQNKSN